MAELKGKLVVAQSGGPTAVFNSSACGVIQEALKHDGFDAVYGASNGIMGILNENLIDMRKESPAQIERMRRTPGSVLGTCRRKLKTEDLERILAVFKAHDIRYFFYNGGNDSMDTANQISRMATDSGYEMRVFGIPKTVDNDLMETDHCPGFGSAARWAAIATRDVGRDTAAGALTTTSIALMEIMGRDAGWLTGATALGREDADSAPHLIYLPEVPFETDQFLDDIKKVHDRLGYVIITLSEGIRDPEGNAITESSTVDAFGHKQLGGVGDFLARTITAKLGIKARANIPGTVQRCSILGASAVDLEEAYLVGQMGVKYALEGHTGYMVALVRESAEPYSCTTGLAPLEKVANFAKSVPAEFITEEGNNVNDKFIAYAKPLAGELLPDYARFEKNQVAKLLEK